MTTQHTHLVVMGVAGAGKTTVGALLAGLLGWPYAEADAFHPPANIDKMAAGVPLDDADRWPWLGALRDWMSDQAAAGHDTVVSCSALRRAYRNVLRGADGRVRFVHLAGDRHLVTGRMAGRSGHFMPTELLTSQYRTLEPLADDEDGLTLTVDAPPDPIARRVVAWLGSTGPGEDGRPESRASGTDHRGGDPGRRRSGAVGPGPRPADVPAGRATDTTDHDGGDE